MKKSLCLFALMLAATVSFSQAYSGSVKFSGSMQPAAVIELNYPEAVVTAALKDYLSAKGRSKANDLKGFTTYRNTQAAHNGTENADLYFKIERKSKQQKNISILYLLLTPVAGNESDLRSLNMEQAKAYLDELVMAVSDFDLEQTIRSQNKLVITAETKQKKLLAEAADLERKRAEMAQKIAENLLLQQAQNLEVQNQKQKLADMVARRRN